MDLRQWFDGLDAAKVRAMLGQQESQVMDCKRLEEKKAGAQLAEIVSGFANAAGGVLLWGVDARKDDSQIDCITGFPGISDPGRLASRLDELTPQAVSPGVAGVVHRALVDEDGKGFIATYVPASEGGPHMAKYGVDRYYQRIGTSFLPMEHFQIADMFGRRARPVLRLSVTPSDAGLVPVINIRLENVGRGVARGTYLLVENIPGMSVPREHRGPLTHKVGVKGWTMFAHDMQELIYPRVPLEFIPLHIPQEFWSATGYESAVFRFRLGAADVEETSGEYQLNFKRGTVWPPVPDTEPDLFSFGRG